MRIPKIGFGIAASAIALTAITTLAPAGSMDDQGFGAESYSAGFTIVQLPPIQTQMEGICQFYVHDGWSMWYYYEIQC